MAVQRAVVTPTQRILHKRFTTEQHGYQLWGLSLSSSEKVAACGRHYRSGRTFIDLYLRRKSDSIDKLEYSYSKEFEKYSDDCYPHISFLKNDSQIVSCIDNKIDIIDTKNESKVLRSCRVNGSIRCVAVRDGEVFIGLRGSQTLIVLNNDLEETKQIILKGIQDGDYPWDIQVVKDTIFVCTYHYGKAYAINERDGRVSEFTDSTGNYDNALSLAVSESLGLVAVVWGWSRIIVYSLNENKSFLVFDDDSNDVTRIRISDRDRMMITGSYWTGEIKIYDLDQLFTFEAMKMTLAYIVRPDECEKLRNHFGVTAELRTGRKMTGDIDNMEGLDDVCKERRMEWVLTMIEEKGHLDPYNINDFKDAMTAICDEMRRVSSLQGPVEGYELYGSNSWKVRYKELTSEITTKQKTWEDERKQLSAVLKAAKTTMNEYEKTIEALECELLKMQNQFEEQEQTLRRQLEQTKPLLDLRKPESAAKLETLKGEFNQARTDSTETIQALTEKLVASTKEIAEALTKELNQTKQSLDLSRAESTKQIDKLTLDLEQTKEKLNSNIKEKETLCRDLEITKQVLEQTKQYTDDTKTELERYQLEFVKESTALKEVLKQNKAAELQKGAMEDKPLDDSEEARGGDFTNLAAEFGRLMVSVAEYLTLDDCLKLATLFDVPPADCDIVRRVSFSEWPGIKFLDILKQRGLINMFDVTNLQKALAMLQLKDVTENVVVPYQENIDEEYHEMYKVEEIFTWDAVHAFYNSVKDNTIRCQIRESRIQEDDTEPDNASLGDTTASQLVTGAEDRGHHLRDRHHQFYTECSIGRQGGTIQLANVSLTIPPDALQESHVIALTVMSESPFALDREVDTSRMTPLIKLEPLGLMFKKSLQLNIPHSALIPEPENHNVIIYSGQMSKSEDLSDYIQWTKESSLPRQLKKKSVAINIQCLSYISASLESQTMGPPLYIVRAVPFVDGVRGADDDVTLTVCFCSDNDLEYNSLLSDYKTKLTLAQYSTLQLHRHSESDKDDAGFLSMTVTSVNNTYVPEAEGTVKRFAVSHLCTASRVSYQLKVKKNQIADRDVVDILLTFSQAHYEPTKLSLKARVKDLILSEESEALLTGHLPQGNNTYIDLMANISSRLDTEQCRVLATHFQLIPEETEITSSQVTGKMLMKTLEDRSVIDSQKMILLFEGLKACHLDETAELVLKYISGMSRKTQEEQKQEEAKIEDKHKSTRAAQYKQKKRQMNARSSRNDQSVQTTLTSSCLSFDDHVETLTKVMKSLETSRKMLVMEGKGQGVLEEE